MVAASPMAVAILREGYINLAVPIIRVVFTRAMATTMVVITIIATTAHMAQVQLARHAGRVVSGVIKISLAVAVLHVTAARLVTFNICLRSTVISVSHIHREWQIHRQ
jgi:hypothetical protein